MDETFITNYDLLRLLEGIVSDGIDHRMEPEQRNRNHRDISKLRCATLKKNTPIHSRVNQYEAPKAFFSGLDVSVYSLKAFEWLLTGPLMSYDHIKVRLSAKRKAVHPLRGKFLDVSL